MKKVTSARGDYLAYFNHLTIVSNIFMRNGIYPLMFIGRVYNNFSVCLLHNIYIMFMDFLKQHHFKSMSQAATDKENEILMPPSYILIWQ